MAYVNNDSTDGMVSQQPAVKDGSRVKTHPSARCKSACREGCACRDENTQRSDRADKKNLKPNFRNLDKMLQNFFEHLEEASQSTTKSMLSSQNKCDVSSKFYEEEVSIRVKVKETPQTDWNITDSLKTCSSMIMLIQAHRQDGKSGGSGMDERGTKCHQADSINGLRKYKSSYTKSESISEKRLSNSHSSCDAMCNEDDPGNSVRLENPTLHKGGRSHNASSKLILREILTDFERAISLPCKPLQKVKKKQNVKEGSQVRASTHAVRAVRSVGQIVGKESGESSDSQIFTMASLQKQVASLPERTSKTVQHILKRSGQETGNEINGQPHNPVCCNSASSMQSLQKGKVSVLQTSLDTGKVAPGGSYMDMNVPPPTPSHISSAAFVPRSEEAQEALYSADGTVDFQTSLIDLPCEKSRASEDIAPCLPLDYLSCPVKILKLKEAESHVPAESQVTDHSHDSDCRQHSHSMFLEMSDTDQTGPHKHSDLMYMVDMIDITKKERHSKHDFASESRMHTLNRPENNVNIAVENCSSSSESSSMSITMSKIDCDSKVCAGKACLNNSSWKSDPHIWPSTDMPGPKTSSKLQVVQDDLMDVALEIEILEYEDSRRVPETPTAAIKQGHCPLLIGNPVSAAGSSPTLEQAILEKNTKEEPPEPTCRMGEGVAVGVDLKQHLTGDQDGSHHPMRGQDVAQHPIRDQDITQHLAVTSSSQEQCSLKTTHQVSYKNPSWQLLESSIRDKDLCRAHKMFRWLEKLQQKSQLRRIPTKLLKSLMNMYIRMKAVPQLLYILVPVCQQRLFDLRAYIQLCSKFPVYLKRILKALKANSLQPGCEEITILLKGFLRDAAFVSQLWEVLCYSCQNQDVPLELVEKAVLLSRNMTSDGSVVNLVNSWVLIAPVGLLCKLTSETLLGLQALLQPKAAQCLKQALHQAQRPHIRDLALQFLENNKDESSQFITSLSDVLLKHDVLENAATFFSCLQENINNGRRYLQMMANTVSIQVSKLASLLLARCCGKTGDDITVKLLEFLQNSQLIDKLHLTVCCVAHSKAVGAHFQMKHQHKAEQLLKGEQLEMSHQESSDYSVGASIPGPVWRNLFPQQPHFVPNLSQQTARPASPSPAAANWCHVQTAPQQSSPSPFTVLPPLPSSPPPPAPPPPPHLPTHQCYGRTDTFLQLPHGQYEAFLSQPAPWGHLQRPVDTYSFRFPPEHHITGQRWKMHGGGAERPWHSRPQWLASSRRGGWRRRKRSSFHDSRLWKPNGCTNESPGPGGW